MPELEYRILCYLRREAVPVFWCKILSDFCILATPTETDAVLKAMLLSGLLSTTYPTADPQLSSVTLSNSGVLKLLQEEDRRSKLESIQQENERKENEKQQAYEKKERDRFAWEQSRKDADTKSEHSFQYRLTLLNAFLNFFLSFLAGLLVEHFTGILGLLINFFS